MSVAMGSFAPSWAELPVGGMAKRGTMTVERREWRGGERGVLLTSSFNKWFIRTDSTLSVKLFFKPNPIKTY